MSSRWERERYEPRHHTIMTHSNELSDEDKKERPGMKPYSSRMEKVGSTHHAELNSMRNRAANEDRK